MLALLTDRRSPETCCVARGSESQAGSALDAVVQISLRRIMEVDSFPYVFVLFSSIGHRPFPPTSRSSFLFALLNFSGKTPLRVRRFGSLEAAMQNRFYARVQQKEELRFQWADRVAFCVPFVVSRADLCFF